MTVGETQQQLAGKLSYAKCLPVAKLTGSKDTHTHNCFTALSPGPRG